MKQRASKTCIVCGREIQWRKKWERNWENVRYCSRACRKDKLRKIDHALEAALLQRLHAEQGGRSIDLSEAVLAVQPGMELETQHSLRERTRRAARRLVNRGLVEILQDGRVLDPSRATGAIQIRLTRESFQRRDI